MGFAAYERVLPPGFLQQPYGAAWAAAHGVVKDLALERMKEAIKARYPTSAPLDALRLIGADRGIFQGPTETIAHYQQRLLNAWGAWSVAGMAWGLLAQLYGMGYSTAYVLYENGYVSGPSSGVLAPDTVNDLPGTPPAVARPQVYYVNGGGSGAWAASTVYQLGYVAAYSSGGVGGVWVCDQAGESGTVSPFVFGQNVPDNKAHWHWLGYFENGSVDLPPQAISPPIPIGSGNGQGVAYAQQTAALTSKPGVTSYGVTPAFGPANPTNYSGEPSFKGSAWTARNWNRYILLFDAPMPSRWSGLTNPPSGAFAAELALISSVVNLWRAGHCQCAGIAIRTATTDPRSAWDWPLAPSGLVTTDGETLPPCWLSRMGSGYGGLAYPTTIPRWLPGRAVTVSQRFMLPSGGGGLGSPPTGPVAYNNPALWFSANAAGATGLIEPTWPTSVGGTVVDNGITWTAGGAVGEWDPPSGVPTVVTFPVSGGS